jgi:ankyrin repeat protein
VISAAAMPALECWQPLEGLIFPMKEQALHGAVGRGDVSAVSKLLQRGHNVNCTNSQGETPLHQAIEQQNVTLVRFLLKKGADPAKLPHYGVSTLYQAVESGNIEIVRMVMQTNVDFSKELQLNSQLNPLILSIVRESVDITRLLLSEKVRVDITNERGETPLVLAAMGIDPDRQLQHAILLLVHGADPHAKDSHGHEAVHYSWHNAFTAYMREYASQPPSLLSLKSMCRKTILNEMVLNPCLTTVEEGVQQLPLPDVLKDYILFVNQSGNSGD